ncbi:hypothetical protein QWY28_13465 [Nocardioides sp. SOB77]|uniref:IrrE N-terminal-like domain-containing protein n=1 Tax=Nocardioides oceani TaxID=3058369 RepID=A0ABT8FHF0_9ACTN|nr:ImmA/IrrE family metallo-endopeptidase [Nocardioides oceani]MDN4173964.1 hypothetical protein [Nocardioides oceani]
MFDRRKIRDHRGHHPWRAIGMLPDWRVEFTRDLAPDELGLTIHAEKRVLIRDGLTQHERRSTICHETGHVLRGPVSSCHQLYEESLVERQASRLLLPSVRRIGHTLAWYAADYTKTAWEMWVDERLLNARLSTLAPADRLWLDEQLDTILI